MVRTPRTFPAPAVVGGGAYTIDELEVLSSDESDIGVWAGRIYRRERDKLLSELSEDSALPEAVFGEDEFGDDRVVALRYGDSYFTGQGWMDTLPFVASGAMTLGADDVAFVARAFKEQIDFVYVRPVTPSAWLDGPIVAAGVDPIAGLPEGAVVAAVVDELDKNAVIDVIAVSPGPATFRRHDSQWREDKTWLHALKSVKPPTLVVLKDALLGSVIAQVDEATAGQPFTKDEEDEAAPDDSLVAAIEAADTRAGLEAALTAAANPAKGAAGAERLRRYWLTGKGAAKIRWGTPGDWTRCFKHLSKYLGPRAKGYCQLMHGRKTGTWAGRNHKTTPDPTVKAKAVAKQLSR